MLADIFSPTEYIIFPSFLVQSAWIISFPFPLCSLVFSLDVINCLRAVVVAKTSEYQAIGKKKPKFQACVKELSSIACLLAEKEDLAS